ncbi:MAG: His/Gly/Thr/Pro-type tRNA ligase C-terminal domain-containing protein [Lacibacter sp.]
MTVDHQTKGDGMVTVRNRDTLIQERIPVSGVKEYVQNSVV